jgi:hypothetical protein
MQVADKLQKAQKIPETAKSKAKQEDRPLLTSASPQTLVAKKQN